MAGNILNLRISVRDNASRHLIDLQVWALIRATGCASWAYLPPREVYACDHMFVTVQAAADTMAQGVAYMHARYVDSARPVVALEA